MLSLCHGCDEIYDGVGDHCPHCYVHGLCDAGKERNDFAARLMSPQPAQRDYLHRLVESMRLDGLQDLVLRLFEYGSPVERTALLDVAAEIADVSPLRDPRNKQCQ
jgi:hypothetical protein